PQVALERLEGNRLAVSRRDRARARLAGKAKFRPAVQIPASKLLAIGPQISCIAQTLHGQADERSRSPAGSPEVFEQLLLPGLERLSPKDAAKLGKIIRGLRRKRLCEGCLARHSLIDGGGRVVVHEAHG